MGPSAASPSSFSSCRRVRVSHLQQSRRRRGSEPRDLAPHSQRFPDRTCSPICGGSPPIICGAGAIAVFARTDAGRRLFSGNQLPRRRCHLRARRLRPFSRIRKGRSSTWRRNPLVSWPQLIHRRIYYRLIEALERGIYPRKALQLAVVSHKVAGDLGHYYGRTGGISVVYDGLDKERFSPLRRGRIALPVAQVPGALGNRFRASADRQRLEEQRPALSAASRRGRPRSSPESARGRTRQSRALCGGNRKARSFRTV